jgi:hypothetical protein
MNRQWRESLRGSPRFACIACQREVGNPITRRQAFAADRRVVIATRSSLAIPQIIRTLQTPFDDPPSRLLAHLLPEEEPWARRSLEWLQCERSAGLVLFANHNTVTFESCADGCGRRGRSRPGCPRKG